jgi:glycosyltransferase involved in cell wall biosynthesis
MADKIVVLTNYYRNYLNKLGITRISVIPDMITPKPLNTIRATTLVEKFKLKNSFIVGVIARFDPAKAPFVLLNACAKLKKEGINFKVLHFGDGELRDKIEQFIKENNLENNYLLMGYLKDPEDFYSIFNCFVLPSIQEGMPNSILNAFYYKVPVIASDIPTIKEFAYGKAILFPSGNPDALSEAIKSVIENKINTKNLIENAFNYVSTYHSPTKIASLYLREYEQLLHKYNL